MSNKFKVSGCIVQYRKEKKSLQNIKTESHRRSKSVSQGEDYSLTLKKSIKGSSTYLIV